MSRSFPSKRRNKIFPAGRYVNFRPVKLLRLSVMNPNNFHFFFYGHPWDISWLLMHWSKQLERLLEKLFSNRFALVQKSAATRDRQYHCSHHSWSSPTKGSSNLTLWCLAAKSGFSSWQTSSWVLLALNRLATRLSRPARVKWTSSNFARRNLMTSFMGFHTTRFHIGTQWVSCLVRYFSMSCSA